MKLRQAVIALGLGIVALIVVTVVKRYSPSKEAVVLSQEEEIPIIQDVPKGTTAPTSALNFSPQVIRVPVLLHPIRSTSSISTSRSDENIINLFNQTQVIWNQANITFDIRIEETSLPKKIARSIDAGDFQSIFTQVRRDDSIHIFFVKDLNNINGVALGQGVAMIADVTSVNDFRATAHEIGHLLGLSHTGNSTARLLYRGVNGVNLIPSEINVARDSAFNYRS